MGDRVTDRYQLADLVQQRGVHKVTEMLTSQLVLQIEEGINLTDWTVDTRPGVVLFARWPRSAAPPDLATGLRRELDRLYAARQRAEDLHPWQPTLREQAAAPFNQRIKEVGERLQSTEDPVPGPAAIELLLVIFSDDEEQYRPDIEASPIPVHVLWRSDLGYDDGVPLAEAAAELGVSLPTLERRMSERGVVPVYGPNPRRGPSRVKLLSLLDIEILR